MLQSIREQAQGWIAGIIFGVLALAFAMWGIQNYLHGSAGSTVAAKVNGHKITQQDLNASYQRARLQQRMQGQAKSLSQAQQAALRKQVLAQLVTTRVLVGAAEKQGFRVGPGQTEAALQQIPLFQANGQFSTERFEAVVSRLLYTPQTFLQHLNNVLLISQLQVGIEMSSFALPNELQRAIRLIDQRRDFGYAVIPVARFKHQVRPSEQDVRAYYKSHQQQFRTPAEVKIAYLKLSPQVIRQQIKVTPKALRLYYAENIDRYSKPQRWQVAQIVIHTPPNASNAQLAQANKKINQMEAQLHAGKSFSDLAKRHSDDRTSAAAGGKLPWFHAGQRSAILVQIVKSLHAGQISSPFRTARGYAIVKLLATQPRQVKSFDKVKAQVRHTFVEQKSQKIFSDNSNTLSELTYTNPTRLDVAAKALTLPIKYTTFFTKKGAKTGLASNPAIVAAAFSDDVLKQNNNSDPIQLAADNSMIVLRVQEFQQAQVMPLVKVRPQIIETLEKKMASSAADTLAQKMIQAIKQGTSPQQVAKKYGVSWHDHTDASRQAAGVDLTILRHAFTLPYPVAHKSSVGSSKLADGSTAIIVVSKVTPGQLTGPRAQQQREVIVKQLMTNRAQLDYALYVKSAQQDADVSYPGKG